MLNFVILWEDRGFFRFFIFVRNAPFLSFCERPVYFFASSILSKMLNFVILWEARVFFRFFNFVKNAQFCHFLRGPCMFFPLLQFCQKCSILSFSERPLDFFASSILSKMLNFVIFWEARVFFFHVLNFVKNAQFCHFVRGPWIFSLLQFCQKCSILSFCERPVYFFAYSILSKMLNFVILWEYREFFCFFNFVKNAQFCHFVRGPWILSLLQFCQKCSILSFCESTVNFFASSILSKMLNFVILWEDRGFYRFFNFVKTFSEKPVCFFRFFNIVITPQYCHFKKPHILCSLFQFCQKWSILSFSERPL